MRACRHDPTTRTGRGSAPPVCYLHNPPPGPRRTDLDRKCWQGPSPPCYKHASLRLHMIKRLFILVFAGLAGVAAASPDVLDPARLRLASASALVFDAATGQPIYAKAADDVTPIASLTKLMTAMVT